MAILVPGGAGYIGSHNVKTLLENGREVVVIDNLLTGHRQAVPREVPFYKGDIRNPADLDKIFANHRIDSVLHFAASSLVAESMVKPLDYFNNNVLGMQSLLAAMVRHKVDKIVFSSSAAVYGKAEKMPIEEDAPLLPTNPYGESKLMMEKMMRWTALAHGMRYVILRYFNVAGAWPGGEIGEDHRPESHLLPLILQTALGNRPHIAIYGEDYPTRDGTCIRDYLDVTDLADAHERALNHLENGAESLVCNLGNGQGYSVREMIDVVRKVTGRDFPVRHEARRPGDPPMLIASSKKAHDELGWQSQKSLEDMIASAWDWHRLHPAGYGD